MQGQTRIMPLCKRKVRLGAQSNQECNLNGYRRKVNFTLNQNQKMLLSDCFTDQQNFYKASMKKHMLTSKQTFIILYFKLLQNSEWGHMGAIEAISF